jgi:hypothetical protein
MADDKNDAAWSVGDLLPEGVERHLHRKNGQDDCRLQRNPVHKRLAGKHVGSDKPCKHWLLSVQSFTLVLDGMIYPCMTKYQASNGCQSVQ